MKKNIYIKGVKGFKVLKMRGFKINKIMFGIFWGKK